MKRAKHQPEQIDITIYAGVFIKTWEVLDAQTVLPQHSHEHPHITMLIQGSVAVERDGVGYGEAHDAPAMIRIPANTLHTFTTLTDNVVLACIHNADHLEGEEPAVAAEHQLQMED